jgi:23S rRNA (cytidine1920-2'-O)/16S rRNA (cytidine1409-2'-O)-methyltransferase
MANFVSRAGEKLQFALVHFEISVKNLTVADFGSSTGGFVDCLLQNEAKKVYSVDTAYGELAWKLRNDPKVIVMERTNAMHVVLPEKVDLITIDVSWTKQKNILPNAFINLKPEGRVISLIKPHYEAGKGRLKAEEVDVVVKKVEEEIEEVRGKIEKLIESPILGEKGKNHEFLALITFR